MDCNQADHEIRTTEEGANPLLKAHKARLGIDGFLVNEVFSKGGEHLRLGHVNDVENGKPVNLKVFRRKDLAENVRVSELFPKPGPFFFRQLLEFTFVIEFQELEAWFYPKMEVQTCFWIRDYSNDGVFEFLANTIIFLEYEIVGPQDPASKEPFFSYECATFDAILFIKKKSPESCGDVHRLQVKGNKDPHGVAFPGSGREDKGNKPLDQFFMTGHKRKILDGATELRNLLEHPLELFQVGNARFSPGLLVSFTVVEERFEAQNTAKRIVLRIDLFHHATLFRRYRIYPGPLSLPTFTPDKRESTFITSAKAGRSLSPIRKGAVGFSCKASHIYYGIDFRKSSGKHKTARY
jgi:hypothetical protein